MKEKILAILKEAADAEINMQSFVAREILANKIMKEFNVILMNEELETNNG